jgi:uncharacterized protein
MRDNPPSAPPALPGWRGLLAALALCLAAACGTLLAGPARAQDLRPVPPLSGRVIDQTGTLSAAQVTSLEARLAAFEREAGSQLVVLIVPGTAPEDIAAYAQRVGDAWKIGRRDVGDGLLIVVAKDDRRLRIEVAKALEGAVPDLAARQIIDRYLTPSFRAGDYAGGLEAAVDALAARIRGEQLPPPKPEAQQPRAPGTQWPDLTLFFLLAVPVLGGVLTAVLGRKLGSLATGAGAGGLAWLATASVVVGVAAALVALLLVGVLGFGAVRRGGRGGGVIPPVIFGGGGGGWGGGGGGGFSSGGGGDFGGGGASGDW